MDKVIPERLKKANATQIEKYGGIEGYRAEMRRRRLLHTKPTGFSIMSKDDIKKAQLRSAKVRKLNAKKKGAHQQDVA